MTTRPLRTEKQNLNTSRRRFLGTASNIVSAAGLAAILPQLAIAQGKPITVGFMYTGVRQDYGWNQAHSAAARQIGKMPAVKVIEQENVPETAEAEKVMESMIKLDGVRVLFPTSFGYWPFIMKIAAKYPDVLFVHAGGLWKDGNPKNTIGYRGYMDEPHYLSGIVAGHMSKTGKIGFIGAKPVYFIVNNCNAFILGARSVNPKITCQVVITGDWNNPVKEAEAVNSLVDQGVDVVVGNCDSPKVVLETAERRGIFSCGYHTDLSALAPKGFLTGAEWNWGKGTEFVKAWQTGGAYPNLLRGGFKLDMVKLSPFGAAVPEKVRKEVLQARQALVEDKLVIYRGPIKDNEGNIVVKAGETIKNDDNQFKLGMKFLVEGAIGKTGLAR